MKGVYVLIIKQPMAWYTLSNSAVDGNFFPCMLVRVAARRRDNIASRDVIPDARTYRATVTVLTSR